MSSGLTILSISADPSLLKTRSYLLRHWGYHVWSAATDSETLELLALPTTFDMVLLCHSLPEPRRVMLVAAIKQRFPQIPVLMLHSGWTKTDAAVTLSCESMVPENILSAIRQLTATHPASPLQPVLAFVASKKQ